MLPIPKSSQQGKMAILALTLHLNCCRRIFAAGFYLSLISYTRGVSSSMWMAFLESIA